MSEIKFLDETKLVLGLEGEENDDLLCLLIDDTVNAVLSYCRIDTLPYQLEGLIPQLVSERFQKNSSGGIKLISEGERRVEYAEPQGVLKEYHDRLKPFISKRVYVPSEITEG